MKKYQPSKSAMNLLSAVTLIISAALCAVVKIYLGFLPIIMWSLIGLFAFIALFILAIYLPLYYKRASFGVSSVQIERTSGILVRTGSVMRVDAVQYITLITTPLSAYTGMNFIVLNALGGKLVLPFLKLTDAMKIYAGLTSEIKARGTKKDKG